MLDQYKVLASELLEDTGVVIGLAEGYRSRYEVLEELKTRVKDKQPSDARFADLLGRQMSGSREYLEFENYIKDLRPTQFEPPLPQDQISIADPSINVYYSPNYPNRDPRRTGRYLIPSPPQLIKSVEVRNWLLNNSLLYGFLLYGDVGLYYVGLGSIKQRIQSGTSITSIVSTYQTTPLTQPITTTNQMVLGDLSATSSNIPSDAEYLIGTPVQDNNGNRPRLLVVNDKVITEGLAEAYFTLRNAAQQDGVTLSIVSGFRPAFGPNVSLESTRGRQISVTTQESIRRNRSTWRNRSSWPGNDEDFIMHAPSTSFQPTAARPGTSKHGSGLALDLNTSTRPHLNTSVYVWLVTNAHRFGFVRTVATEEWHFEYLPQQAPSGPYAVLADTNANKFYSDLGLSGLPA